MEAIKPGICMVWECPHTGLQRTPKAQWTYGSLISHSVTKIDMAMDQEQAETLNLYHIQDSNEWAGTEEALAPHGNMQT